MCMHRGLVQALMVCLVVGVWVVGAVKSPPSIMPPMHICMRPHMLMWLCTHACRARLHVWAHVCHPPAFVHLCVASCT